MIEPVRKSVFQAMIRTLLLSKLVFCCRVMTSSMRGCCHRPGVEVEGEGWCCCCCCCCGVDAVLAGVVSFDCGVKFKFGRMLVMDVVAGDEVFGCEVERMRLPEEDERTRAVVEEEERTKAVVDDMVAAVCRRSRFRSGYPLLCYTALCCGG